MKTLFKRQTETYQYHKYYLLLQKRWADKMGELTDGLSKKKLISALMLFTALISGILIYRLYSAFDKDTEVPKNFINAPKIKTINLKH